MIKLRLILTLFVLTIAAVVNAQQFDNWYFGRRSAISFSPAGTQPVPHTLSNSEMVADEGSASVSDVNGNLLFYTNSTVVYNKQHDTMVNGMGLLGNISACQMAIVPQPGNDSIFFLFTTDAIEGNFTNGYRYSIINTKRQNGLGEVVSKNNMLWASCTERITAARHANGIDIWVITNDNASNIFRAWLVTCAGIAFSPVSSTVGDVISGRREVDAGVIKVSPDGTKLAQTHFPIYDEFTNPPNFFQLFDFDNSTGVISNARHFSFAAGQFTHCEFSPDSRLLYVTRPYERKIDQYDISSGSTATISATRFTLATQLPYFDIQIGPDEKNYITAPSAPLAVIHNPSVQGIGCNLQERFINFSTGATGFSLPSFINDAGGTGNTNNGFIIQVTDSCLGRVQFSGFSNLPPTISWQWDFGDGNTSVLQNPLHTYADPTGNYRVKLTIRSGASCGTIVRSKFVNPAGTSTGKAAFQAIVRCDSGYVRFENQSTNLANLSGAFVWNFGDGNTSTDVHPIHHFAPGNYIVKLKVNAGPACLQDSVTHPVEVKAFVVETIPDQVIRVGEKVFLSTREPATVFHWSPSRWLTDTTIRNPVAMPEEDIMYKVISARADGCVGEDSVFIRVIQYSDIYVPTGFTPNGDGRNDIIFPYYPGSLNLKNFSIHNRWGQRIFSTAQRGIGWDGRINGVVQSTDSYVWSIELNDIKGETIRRAGTFILIR